MNDAHEETPWIKELEELKEKHGMESLMRAATALECAKAEVEGVFIEAQFIGIGHFDVPTKMGLMFCAAKAAEAMAESQTS
jgi:hypothetical protein